MISRFFIDRPIFAAVISIVITLAGSIALFTLPIAQYPPIAPPTVQVSCTYPGRQRLQVVADTIAAPIEQQVNGVEGMLYMSSQSANDGSYNLTITFDLGTDLNTALVMVQNRVSLATPQLPNVGPATIGRGRSRRSAEHPARSSTSSSPDGRYDGHLYLSNYATIFASRTNCLRLPGVGDVTYLGQRDYSIRAWLDPQKMASRSITANEVAHRHPEPERRGFGRADRPAADRTRVSGFPTADRHARPPASPEQFDDIVIKAEPDDSDAGRRPSSSACATWPASSWGRRTTTSPARSTRMPSVGMAIYQFPGTNALDVAEGVRARRWKS